jgi:hypothetical protein
VTDTPELPFSLEAASPSDYAEDMAAFVKAATGHPWVGNAPGRVVISDDLVATMREYMPAAGFNAWFDRQRARHDASGALGVGMAFVARDGVRTAAIANLGSREDVLWLFAHEYIEAAMDERALSPLDSTVPRPPKPSTGARSGANM